LNKERRELLDRRRRLLSRPVAIARVAREQFGFAAPGERTVQGEGRTVEPNESPEIRLKPAPLSWCLGNGGYPWVVPGGVFVVSFALLICLKPSERGSC
jgi:hypothetical protein